tara:strand:+ start:4637 stop:5521 length:885 start_codon:yes stop_codon:yes gene_type:complete
MARCLVTGHRGYIGSRLYNKLKELGHEVMGIDVAGEYGKDINGLQGLIEDSNKKFHPIWANFSPEYIFHLACIPRVGYSIEEPVITAANNILAGSNVLNFAAKNGVKRVIYSSSSSVVGNGDGPTSPYALQKLTTERECKIYADIYGLDTVSLRYFNVYSEDQEVSGPYATAIANWMHYIRNGDTPYITGDGSQRRDMLYVHDAVAANIFAMDYKDRFNGQHFDVGTGDNISLNEVKDIVNDVFPEVAFDYIKERPGDVMLTKANTEPLKNLGWQTKMSIEEGIRNCFMGVKND